jgi:hypothetical protein
MKKKKNKTIKNVRSSDQTSQKIPTIADFGESYIDFLDETEEDMDFETDDNLDDDEIVIPYDTVWKTIIVEFYADFIQFFLPDLFTKLDTSVEPVFLDQELLAIQKELNIPKQITDKLIKVRLKDGSEQWVLIHIEIQTKFEILFSTRMYLYKAFIFAKHRLPITALAIFTRASTPKTFNIYETECFGTSLTYRYNAYRIAKQNEVALTNSDNIFSLFVLAHLYVIKTTPKKYEQRLTFKEKLFDLAKQQQFDDDKVERMLIFVNQIMELPIQLQNSFLEIMAHKDPDQEMLETQAKMKASEAFIIGYVRRARIKQLGWEGYIKQKAAFLDAELDAKIEAIAQSRTAKIEAKAKEELRKAEAEAKAELRKAKQKAKAEMEAKVEAEKQKAEAKAEAEKQKAEAEKQKAEAKAEAEKLHYQIHSVIALHEQAAFNEDKVATILQLPLNEVGFILSQHKQAVPMDAIVPKLKEFRDNLLKTK